MATTTSKPARLKWKDDTAETEFGRYVIVKHRIRHGTRYETEYEVALGEKCVGIADTKANVKQVAQSHYAYAQRKVARRKRGSHGRRKAVLLLQKAHAHIRNQRSDFHHKTSRQVVNKHALIAIEDLNVKGLARTRLAKSVHDAGWSQFFEQLAYKAEDAGRRFVRVNPNGTSQNCSGCGARVEKTLSERVHQCDDCGLVLDRDHNAAQNILRLGMSLVALTWPVGASVAAENALHAQQKALVHK